MRLWRCVPCAVLICVMAGCSGDAVVEDRTITFGSSNAVAFQHGSSGVFIEVDGAPKRIFEPDDNVLATSTPQWSPDKTQVMFTVAVNETEQSSTSDAGWSDTPDGRIYGANGLVNYDCYVYQLDSDKPAEKIFSSQVKHVGYVAANLATQWTPDGSGIVFIASENESHELKRWNPATQSNERVFPHLCKWLVFNFVPGSDQLVVCVEGRSNDGIWIGTGDDWWRVSEGRGPRRLQLATSDIASFFSGVLTSDSPIERLRGLMPVWSVDSQQFAFVTATEPAETSGKEASYAVSVATLADRNVSVFHESTSPVFDVRWHPESQSLGVVHYDDDKPALSSLSLADKTLSRLTDHSVHQFAGWNKSNTEFAFVAPTKEPAARDDWAFAMARLEPSREELIVTGSAGERTLFAGTRVTFPNWSPDGTKISFWSTFVPTHRSWVNVLYGGGLPNGDPAVTVDVRTGDLQWLPVSAIEQLQVGHYYLLNSDAATALKWYDKAEPDLPEQDESNQIHLLARHLYRSIALAMSDRNNESNEVFDKYMTEFRWTPGSRMPESEDPTQLATSQKYLTLLEVYQSVDQIARLQSRLSDLIAGGSKSEDEKLLQLIAMSQVRLLQDQHEEYAQLMGEQLLPLAHKLLSDVATFKNLNSDNPRLFLTQLSLLPLYSTEYLQQLNSEVLASLVKQVEALRPDSTEQIAAALNAMLIRLHGASDDPASERIAAERLHANPRASDFEDSSIRHCIAVLRCFPHLTLAEEMMSGTE